MESIKKIIHYLSWGIYTCIIIYAIFWLPSIFGYKPLVVLSESMEPTLKKGSLIYYESIDKEKIKIGDIITFSANNEFISHRIVSIADDLYETKGDANDVSDAVKIKYENIYGKNTNVNINYVGYYIKFINEHHYLVIISILVLIIEFLLSNYVGKENLNEK